VFRRKLKALFNKGIRPHFSQNGEDILIRHYLRNIKIGSYFDLGAYDPFKLSNTAILWAEGWSGCNVDANPASIKKFDSIRPDDKNICAAIVTKEEKLEGKNKLTFYVDGGDSSQQSARGSILQTKREQTSIVVDTLSLEQVWLASGLKEVDYLNVDLEGYDERVINEFDRDLFSPKVITVEDHKSCLDEVLSSPITRKLESEGYHLVGRSLMTSVFAAVN